MSSYTKGPWTAKEIKNGGWGVYSWSGELLAESNALANKADIQLMAAAPELITLLKHTAFYADFYDTCMDGEAEYTGESRYVRDTILDFLWRFEGDADIGW